MSLTSNEWMSLILLEVGAGLDGSDPVDKQIIDQVTPNIGLIWAAWADKALVYPRLQYLYTKRQCLDIIEGQLRDLVSTQIGSFNVNGQQRLQNLQAIHKRVDEEIEKLEEQARASRGPVKGDLEQTAPSMADPGKPDPNNPVYRGDAIVRPQRPDPYGWRPGGIR